MDPEDILGGNSGNDDGNNPAWNDLLAVIPEDIHEQVIPHLKNWDTGVQNKIQGVHSEWAPYKFLKDENVADEDVRVALGVVRAIQEDPEAVYKSLAESYGFDADKSGQGAPASGQNDDDFTSLPKAVQDKILALEGGYNTVAEILLQQKNEREAAETQAQADAALQQNLAQLKTTHGNFNEGFVLSQMQTGMSGDDAVAAYKQMVTEILTENNKPAPPRLLGSGGGGIPGNGKIDPTKMSPAETKNLVVEYLAAKAAENR